jgi:LAO/AO transport system kinase
MEPSSLVVLPGIEAPATLARRPPPPRRSLSPAELAAGIRAGSRSSLSQAISLVESSRESDRARSAELLRLLADRMGDSVRVGITGVPGVGKSTLIEALGRLLLEDPTERVAVLAVDPSSPLTKGSILGDKSRMGWLSSQDRAYVRPSPSRGSLGGVASRTREVIQLCEAAGCRTIIVETVGVGQSEVAVEGLVDCFLLLMLAGAGDEVQGIKKGVIEMADAIAITKADGDNLVKAKVARQMVLNALHMVARKGPEVPVAICSSATGEGLQEVWGLVREFVDRAKRTGDFEARRARQGSRWLRQMMDEEVLDRYYRQPGLEAVLAAATHEVERGALTPRMAAEIVFRRFPVDGGYHPPST